MLAQLARKGDELRAQQSDRKRKRPREPSGAAPAPAGKYAARLGGGGGAAPGKRLRAEATHASSVDLAGLDLSAMGASGMSRVLSSTDVQRYGGLRPRDKLARLNPKESLALQTLCEMQNAAASYVEEWGQHVDSAMAFAKPVY